jgi:hypothetical protein
MNWSGPGNTVFKAVDRIEVALSEIVSYVRSRDPFVTLVLVKHHPWYDYCHKDEVACNGGLCSYYVNRWMDLERLTGSIEVVDLDHLGRWLNEVEMMTLDEKYDAGDGVHLNYRGHQELAASVVDKVWL